MAHVVTLIEQHDLFHLIQDKLRDVAEADPGKALPLFVQHIHRVPMKAVVQQLSPNPDLLLTYLTEMFNSRRSEYDVEDMAQYHNLQIQLHVTHKVSVVC